MTNYLKRNFGGVASLRDETRDLLQTEDDSIGLSNKGWGPKGDKMTRTLDLLVKGMYNPVACCQLCQTLCGDETDPPVLKVAYVLCCKVVPCDRRFVIARATSVYEAGKEILKREAIKQSKKAAKKLAIFAVKMGAKYGGQALLGVDGLDTVVEVVIDYVEKAQEAAQEIWEACE